MPKPVMSAIIRWVSVICAQRHENAYVMILYHSDTTNASIIYN